jgi:hypothetical protein
MDKKRISAKLIIALSSLIFLFDSPASVVRLPGA